MDKIQGKTIKCAEKGLLQSTLGHFRTYKIIAVGKTEHVLC